MFFLSNYSEAFGCENPGAAQLDDCRSPLRGVLRILRLSAKCHHHLVQGKTAITTHKG